MKKLSMLVILAIVVFIGRVTASSASDGWQTYANKQFGYQIRLPADGKLAATGEKVRDNFYLDPLQPAADLTHYPAFNSVRLDADSLVKIAFPDNKYLVILVLDHAPPDTPPPNTQPAYIGQHLFYQQHSWDAGMCHDYEYYTYYLEHNKRYYVFIFLLTSNCFTPPKSAEASHANTQDFERILSTFRWEYESVTLERLTAPAVVIKLTAHSVKAVTRMNPLLHTF